MKFDKVFKLYVFKEKDRANLSLQVSNNLVIEYRIQNEYKRITIYY